jgi:hypothetical protein
MKNIFITIICIVCIKVVKAQVVITPTISKPNIGTIYNGPWVEIYQKKMYQGIKKTITTNSTTTIDLGFRPDTISVKIKPGYVAYLSINCQEFSNEVAFFENNSQYVLRQNEICGIRIEKAIDYWVQFNAILAKIHNNDCKKFYGTIKYKIFELNERNERVYYNIGDGGGVEKTAYNKPKTTDAVEANLYNIDEYYIADRDYIDGVITDPRRYKPNVNTKGSAASKHNFKINEVAYRNNKIFIECTTKIGSYHKGCDLCTDFTKDAEMPAGITNVYNVKMSTRGTVKFASNILQVGPFRAAPAGNTKFTGGGGFNDASGPAYHTTYVQFSLKD